MDIGFEGNFQCLTKSINQELHPDWVKENLEINYPHEYVIYEDNDILVVNKKGK